MSGQPLYDEEVVREEKLREILSSLMSSTKMVTHENVWYDSKDLDEAVTKIQELYEVQELGALCKAVREFAFPMTSGCLDCMSCQKATDELKRQVEGEYEPFNK